MSNNKTKNSDENNPVFNKLMESLENQKRKREEEERKKKTTIILKRKKKSKVTVNDFQSPGNTTTLRAVHINTGNKPSSSRKLFNKMKSKINDINNNINELKRMESDEKFTPEEKRILYDLLIDSENQIDNIACDLDKFEFNTEFLDNEYDNLTEDTKKQMQGNPVPPKDNSPVYFKHKIKF